MGGIIILTTVAQYLLLTIKAACSLLGGLYVGSKIFEKTPLWEKYKNDKEMKWIPYILILLISLPFIGIITVIMNFLGF